jgi:gamma-glutamyltranspeptidase/glutathione hydrolase
MRVDRIERNGQSEMSMHRRQLLKHTAAWGLASVTAPHVGWTSEKDETKGTVVGEPTAAKVGQQVLAEGGNAVDAVVAAALVAAVVTPHHCGVGGYGGVFMIASQAGRPIAAIDFNTTAPKALRADSFKPGPDGKVPGQVNDRGWLAAGVPGVLAGLQFALDRYGTRKFGDLAPPAIALARDGFTLEQNLATILRNHASALAQDAGSRKLFFRDDKPLAAGDTLRNPELADLLATLAERNRVDSFYHGDIAQHIAEAFARHGGLVTAEDLAAYRVREPSPLVLDWDGFSIHTAPLTAGGLTTLQALHALKALNWAKLPSGLARTHARIEALRLAWRDRLALLGDSEHAEVPVERLLSADYARQSATQIETAVKAGRAITFPVAAPKAHGGTIHLSAVDQRGMLAAVTLTHGSSFGARVTIEGLGLTLGHGMSRFDPRPEHPNAPGPGKRPLHNMCPTIVLHEGQPFLAVGGRGGRKIVNAVFDFLLPLVALGKSPEEAIATPRLHTEGDLALTLEAAWPDSDVDACKKPGFTITRGPSAVLSAAWMDPRSGVSGSAAR